MISFACQDIEFRDLVRCSFKLNKTEYNVMMFLLVSGKSLRAQDIGTTMQLDRTTVQKAIKKLAEKELVERHQENLGKGGYLYHYRIKNKDDIKQRMLTIVDRWHESVVSEINKW
jgi:predicted transcriptional regulator